MKVVTAMVERVNEPGGGKAPTTVHHPGSIVLEGRGSTVSHLHDSAVGDHHVTDGILGTAPVNGCDGAVLDDG